MWRRGSWRAWGPKQSEQSKTGRDSSSSRPARSGPAAAPLWVMKADAVRGRRPAGRAPLGRVFTGDPQRHPYTTTHTKELRCRQRLPADGSETVCDNYKCRLGLQKRTLWWSERGPCLYNQVFTNQPQLSKYLSLLTIYKDMERITHW